MKRAFHYAARLYGSIASSRFALCTALISSAAGPISAEEKANTKPLVQKLENGNYQIGKITFNKDSREITIPARANIVHQDTIIEYLLVHLNGEKVHEALLITEADPTHINIALKLLSYKESQELFRILNEDGSLSDKYTEVPEAIKKAARHTMGLQWLLRS